MSAPTAADLARIQDSMKPSAGSGAPPTTPPLLAMLNIKGGVPVLNFGPKSAEALPTSLTPQAPTSIMGKKFASLSSSQKTVPIGFKWGYDGPINPTGIPQANQMDSSGIGGGHDNAPSGRGAGR